MENKSKHIIPNSVITPPVMSLNDFFRNWLVFLRPYHELTDRQLDFAAAFLRKRYELSKVISDNNILDEVLMSESKKKEIIEEFKVSTPHFQVMMSALRKHNFIKADNKINPKYIPRLEEDPKKFSLMVLWKIE